MISPEEHYFVLVSTKDHCRITTLYVNFIPQGKKKGPSNSIVPVFLNDRKHFTPSFVLARDREFYLSDFLFDKDSFQRNARQQDIFHLNLQNPNYIPKNMLLPKPSYHYCYVCHQKFDDYIVHIHDIPHLRQSRFSKADTYIKQLCKKIKKRNATENAHKTNKPIKKVDSKKKEKPKGNKKNSKEGGKIKVDCQNSSQKKKGNKRGAQKR